MKGKPKPKAYIKEQYKGNPELLPKGNPFGVKKTTLLDRNSIEFKEQTKAVRDVLNSKKSSPIMSKITF